MNLVSPEPTLERRIMSLDVDAPIADSDVSRAEGVGIEQLTPRVPQMEVANGTALNNRETESPNWVDTKSLEPPDNIDNQYPTDSFVPRSTLASKCPLLSDDEMQEEKDTYKRNRGGADEVDAEAALEGLDDEDDELMMIRLQSYTTPDPPRWFIIMPSNHKRGYWDLLVVLCVLYNVAIVPMDVAFTLGTAINVLNYVTDLCIFGVDMIVHLVSAYVDVKEGTLVVEPKRVALHYLQTPWFWVDFVSTVPWDVIFLPLNTGSTKIVFKVLGSVKLLRLMRLSKFFRWLNERLGAYATIVRLFQLFFIFMLCAHTVGCLYWWLDTTVYGGTDLNAGRGLNGMVLDDASWFLQEECMERMSVQYHNAGGSELWADMSVDEKSECVYLPTLYTALFYFGVQALVGEGQDTAGIVTTLFLSLSTIIGCGLAAVIFGNVADIVANTQSLSGHIKAKHDMIHDTLLKLDLPAQLRERITEFHEFRMKRMGGMEANIFFDELSPKIQLETRSEVNMTLLRAQDIFERLPEPCVAKLALCAKRQFFAPHDLIFKEGEIGDSMFVIAFGFVVITSSLHADKFTRQGSEYFGELAVFRLKARQPAIIPLLHSATNQRRTGTAMSVTFSEVLEIRATDLAPILRMRGTALANEKLWKGFKDRAMMLNMMCKSLVWIQVDNCFYAWRALCASTRRAQGLDLQISEVNDKVDRLVEEVGSRFDRLDKVLAKLASSSDVSREIAD